MADQNWHSTPQTDCWKPPRRVPRHWRKVDVFVVGAMPMTPGTKQSSFLDFWYQVAMQIPRKRENPTTTSCRSAMRTLLRTTRFKKYGGFLLQTVPNRVAMQIEQVETHISWCQAQKSDWQKVHFIMQPQGGAHQLGHFGAPGWYVRGNPDVA